MYRKFKLNLLPNNLEEISINCYYGINENINYMTNNIKKMHVSDIERILNNLPNSAKFIFLGNRTKKILNKYISQIKIKGR